VPLDYQRYGVVPKPSVDDRAALGEDARPGSRSDTGVLCSNALRSANTALRDAEESGRASIAALSHVSQLLQGVVTASASRQPSPVTVQRAIQDGINLALDCMTRAVTRSVRARRTFALDNLCPSQDLYNRLLRTPMTGPGLFGGEGCRHLQETVTLVNNQRALREQFEVLRRANVRAAPPAYRPLQARGGSGQVRGQPPSQRRPRPRAIRPAARGAQAPQAQSARQPPAHRGARGAGRGARGSGRGNRS
jgi:hypothetical protein